MTFVVEAAKVSTRTRCFQDTYAKFILCGRKLLLQKLAVLRVTTEDLSWRWQQRLRPRLTHPSSSAVSMYVRLCGSLLDSNSRSA